MEDVLEVYQRPRDPERPVVCFDVYRGRRHRAYADALGEVEPLCRCELLSPEKIRERSHSFAGRRIGNALTRQSLNSCVRLPPQPHVAPAPAPISTPAGGGVPAQRKRAGILNCSGSTNQATLRQTAALSASLPAAKKIDV